MASKRLLWLIGEGLGNQVETIPGFLYLCSVYPDAEIDVCNMIPTRYNAIHTLYGHLANRIIDFDKVNQKDYDGQYATFCCAMAGLRFPNIPYLNRDVNRWLFSEVRYNLEIINDQYVDKHISLEPFFQNEYDRGMPDVIIHNGYNKSSGIWEAKGYPYYKELVKLFLGAKFTVGSIGSLDEHIEGTANYTNKSLLDTIRIMRSCKVFISNDTGTYHLANLLGVPNIVIFTFTSVEKNHDPLFHRFSCLIKNDLPCSPCQSKLPPKFWLHNKDNCHWQCREINPQQIFGLAIGIMQ